MEIPTQNRIFTKRKFWFPVGVFSLVFLPMLLYFSIQNKIVERKEYIFELITPNGTICHEGIYKPLLLDYSDSNRFQSQNFKIALKGAYDLLNNSQKSTISEIILKYPANLSYDEFFSILNSLSTGRVSCGLDKGNNIITIYHQLEILPDIGNYNECPQVISVPKKQYQVNLNFKHYIILGICFPVLAFFNLRNLIHLIKSRKHFPA